MERLLDRVARELQLDRAEVRRRNLIGPEQMPYAKPLKTRGGIPVTLDSGNYLKCQQMALERARTGMVSVPASRRRGRRAAISASVSRTS